MAFLMRSRVRDTEKKGGKWSADWISLTPLSILSTDSGLTRFAGGGYYPKQKSISPDSHSAFIVWKENRPTLISVSLADFSMLNYIEVAASLGYPFLINNEAWDSSSSRQAEGYDTTNIQSIVAQGSTAQRCRFSHPVRSDEKGRSSATRDSGETGDPVWLWVSLRWTTKQILTRSSGKSCWRFLKCRPERQTTEFKCRPEGLQFCISWILGTFDKRANIANEESWPSPEDNPETNLSAQPGCCVEIDKGLGCCREGSHVEVLSPERQQYSWR